MRAKVAPDEPAGNMQFHFKDAGLKFHAESLSWLVMADDRAVFGGRGTINGEGLYSFWASVLDGKHAGDGDRFRIQIRELIPGSGVIPGPVVYDNEIGKPDYGAPDTVIKGNIAFHQVNSSPAPIGKQPSGKPSSLVAGNPPQAVLAELGILGSGDPAAKKVLLPLLTH